MYFIYKRCVFYIQEVSYIYNESKNLCRQQENKMLNTDMSTMETNDSMSETEEEQRHHKVSEYEHVPV